MKVLSSLPSITAFLACLGSGISHADLQPMGEEGMDEVTGAGIIYLPENFRIEFDDLSYVKTLVSSTPPPCLGATVCNNKAELIWYGLKLGGANGSVTSTSGSVIPSWGTATNPWLLKVETLTRTPWAASGSPAAVALPILNYYAPTYTPGEGGLKYGFWGDIISRDRVTDAIPTDGKLQSQNIWNDFTLNGSRMSMFQNTYDQSFGMAWLNRINSSATGQYRFSVAQTNQPIGALDAPATAVPTFNNVEGFYVTDLDINMVVGTFHYQPLIFGAADTTSQNFQVELVRIPNAPGIYQKHYRDYSLTTAAEMAKMCTNTTADCAAATHGEINMGKVEFKSPSGVSVDLGSAKISGLLINHLKIKTLGL